MKKQSAFKNAGVSSIVDAALDLAALGKPVFPCWNKPNNKRKHKTPRTPHGFKDATCDVVKITDWWQKWPDALIGMPTGPASGIDVLDLDTKNGKNGLAEVPDWQERSSVIARTVSGGAHLYFASDGTISSTADQIARGVDTRGKGGYVVVPPSPGYHWVNGHDLSNLPPWPDDLRPREKQQTAPGKKINTYPPADRAEIEAALAVTPADHYQVWFENGCALYKELGDDGFELFDRWSQKSDKYSARECASKWRQCKKEWNERGKTTGFTAGTIFHRAEEAKPGWREAHKAAELKRALADIRKQATSKKTTKTKIAESETEEATATAPAFSEEFLALEFAKSLCHKLRYVAKWGKWFLFDEKLWTRACSHMQETLVPQRSDTSDTCADYRRPSKWMFPPARRLKRRDVSDVSDRCGTGTSATPAQAARPSRCGSPDHPTRIEAPLEDIQSGYAPAPLGPPPMRSPQKQMSLRFCLAPPGLNRWPGGRFGGGEHCAFRQYPAGD